MVPNIASGAQLLALVDRMGTDPSADPTEERTSLVAEIGDAATERAIGVAATFQMMNRLLDGVGAPVRGRSHFGAVAESLGFSLDDLPR